MRILIAGDEPELVGTDGAGTRSLVCFEARTISYYGGPNRSLRIYESVREYWAVYGVSVEQADYIARLAFETGQVDFTNLVINGEKTNFVANGWFSFDDDEDEDDDSVDDESDLEDQQSSGFVRERKEKLGVLNDIECGDSHKGIFGMFRK